MTLQIPAAIVLMMASISCSIIQDVSKLAARTTPVKVQEQAPDFTLEDQSNWKVTLSSGFGKTPTVLVFYRGSW